MFYGTKFWFKILYFITAMSPAYMLYSLYFYSQNENIPFISKEYKFLILIFLLLLLLILLAYILKGILIKTTKNNENPYSLRINIKDQNGNSLIFLLSVIIPSVIYIDESPTINIIIFLLIQYLLFVLMNNSTALFPNVLLIIIGIHTFRLDEGRYIISNQLTHKSKDKISATSIGDNSSTLCYVKGD